uniref:Uncharacterized protein n=1 Tax=Cannabis sativa TaxID=3483 RepID=A0A803R2H5_CANSA
MSNGKIWKKSKRMNKQKKDKKFKRLIVKEKNTFLFIFFMYVSFFYNSDFFFPYLNFLVCDFFFHFLSCGHIWAHSLEISSQFPLAGYLLKIYIFSK